jgi:membrane-bound serine protease (ClpP class)
MLAVLVASAEEAASASPPAATSGSDQPAVMAAPEKGKPVRKVTIYVVPIRDQIAQPVLYILRRGLKEAIERQADVVILDMETPGGALDVTFEIMEALGKFSGQTITFVDKEAVSAGAFISATTQEIWFAPGGVIGAAAPVMATGQDIDETMKLKIISYLKARVRAISEGKGYRGQVISAMIDKDFELKIGDTVIKPKGELLSLTASEAAKTYGDPPSSSARNGHCKEYRRSAAAEVRRGWL